MKKGEAKATVKMEVDINGVLNLTAIDKQNTDNKSKITIVNDKDRLTAQEIAKLIEEAQIYEEEDKKQLKIIEDKLKAEGK